VCISDCWWFEWNWSCSDRKDSQRRDKYYYSDKESGRVFNVKYTNAYIETKVGDYTHPDVSMLNVNCEALESY